MCLVEDDLRRTGGGGGGILNTSEKRGFVMSR